ncbi:MAG: helix-turn-helix domain-containing protein [Siphonobacter aquaeclarae]|nr:helix-turn-helix domain-containing protein [Siphonobacter aquaeclarae]
MQIVRENVVFEPGQSFRVFSPSLRHYFLWHYHPEFELVYVEAVTGIRHVGSSVTSYDGSDLILIGSNVPHLNFDYGIETDYEQIVIQLREQFRETLLGAPEFGAIDRLLERAYLGLVFRGETKRVAAEKIRRMQTLRGYEALMALLDILQLLAHSSEVTELNTEDTRVKLFLNDKIRMGTVYDYIHARYNRQPDVNEIATQVHLSTSAFCRYFKRQTQMTFTDFVNHYRISQAKTLLLRDLSVSEVCYQVGIESLSYFNKTFRTLVGETPTGFKKKHLKK